MDATIDPPEGAQHVRAVALIEEFERLASSDVLHVGDILQARMDDAERKLAALRATRSRTDEEAIADHELTAAIRRAHEQARLQLEATARAAEQCRRLQDALEELQFSATMWRMLSTNVLIEASTMSDAARQEILPITVELAEINRRVNICYYEVKPTIERLMPVVNRLRSSTEEALRTIERMTTGATSFVAGTALDVAAFHQASARAIERVDGELSHLKAACSSAISGLQRFDPIVQKLRKLDQEIAAARSVASGDPVRPLLHSAVLIETDAADADAIAADAGELLLF